MIPFAITQRPTCGQANFFARPNVLPLPKGEGWGEGEGNARTTIATASDFNLRGIFRGRASVLFVSALLLTSGCTSFNHDWRKAAQSPAPANDILGRWQGVWVSDVTHHTDQLRCVITKKDDDSYRARFRAKYHHVLTFGYTVPLKVEPATNGFTFSGEANLGWLAGGVYHYAGHADVTNYFSTYSCKYDHGTFQMSRP